MSRAITKLEKLIAELCPNGVEFRKLGEVCEVKTGKTIGKREIAQNPGEYPVINSGKEPLGFVNIFNEEDNPIGIASRGSVGLVTWTEGRFFRGGLNYATTIRNKQELSKRFLYHFLLQSSSEIQKLCTFEGIPALNKGNLETLKIPIPPLEVQEEIVRILDKFTQLEAELEAELEARKKQYSHYRNALLSFENPEDAVGVRWVKLGEICENTKNINWKENLGATFKYIDLSSVSRDSHTILETSSITSENKPSRAQKLVKTNDVIFATTRPTQNRSYFVSDKFDNQICSTGFCVLRANLELVDPKYIYYIIGSSKFMDYVAANESGSAYPAISDSLVKSFEIPLPPLEKQKEIVEILDRFESLTNDISKGLPAEITARRKQYEFYRNKLLTFNELP